MDVIGGKVDEIFEMSIVPEKPLTSDNRLSPCHATLPIPICGPISNIRDFVETTIVLKKDKHELGISVAGGNDTYLESVCVTKVHKGGAAYKDGRLQAGDLLLAVNEIPLWGLPAAEALRSLREAPSLVRLLVLRENPQKLFTTNKSITKFITEELRKSSVTERLGLSMMQRANGQGVFITYVQPGSIAARHGRRILQGDQILEINGHNVRESNQKNVADILKNTDGAIVLLLGRVPSLTGTIQEWARTKLRNRTSTWSAYSDATKEKLQAQRPSLPVGHQHTTAGFPSYPPSASPSREVSPSASSRRLRLSIVTENKHGLVGVNCLNRRNNDDMDFHEPEDLVDNGADHPLLPSIKITSF
ncbi:inaD-like protein [Limulus polyphemus]|uniref:InaD-like protein n=1 Tax=Limulus polyphemus TaxID=6850 RepID=A0ABM1SM13_LIMPO|nr:inaD-like protein [Limulus polyphemus]